MPLNSFLPERKRLEECVKEKTEEGMLLTGSFSVADTCSSAHTHIHTHAQF